MNRRRLLEILHASLFVAAAASCSSSADPLQDGPPKICRAPSAPQGPLFTEITAEVGLAKTASLEPLGTNIIPADMDGDGWTDFYASFFPASREPHGTKRTRFLFVSRPDPADPSKRVFVDMLDASGLLQTRDGQGGRGLTGITFGDFDNDGDLDALGCASEIAPTILDNCGVFANDGTGHFTLLPPVGDVENDLFSSGGAALLDWDRDGNIDVMPATIGRWQYFNQTAGTPLSKMRAWKGAGDGTFTDVAQQIGFPPGYTDGYDYRMIFGITGCDVDVDGDRDLLIAEYGTSLGPNHLYRNDDGVFTDVGAQLGVAKGKGGGAGFTCSIACTDFDNDGDVDLFTSELHHAWYPTTDFSEPLINNTPVGQPLQPFARVGRATLGLDRPHVGNKWTEGDSQVLFGDYDLDGRKDVMILSINYPQQSGTDPDWTHAWLYHQKADKTFEDVTMSTPFWDKRLQSLGNGSLIDLDHDGDLDLVTGTGTYNSQYLMLTNALHVFRNDAGQSSNFVRVRVVGKGAGGSNRFGVGARVEVVTADGNRQQAEIGTGVGLQNDTELTFGLGANCEIAKLIVHWPNGTSTTSTYTNVAANYLVELNEATPDETGAPRLTYKNLDGSALGAPVK